jgi:hypothetical protein
VWAHRGTELRAEGCRIATGRVVRKEFLERPGQRRIGGSQRRQIRVALRRAKIEQYIEQRRDARPLGFIERIQRNSLSMVPGVSFAAPQGDARIAMCRSSHDVDSPA